MASEERSDGGKEKEDSIDATIKATEENLASLRRTIEAIDSLETRWKDVQRKFGEVLASSLSSAFGVAPPCSLTDEEKLSVFGGKPSLAELCKRLKERHYRKVIVMTGAGVSVSAGIPDFRSPGSGLYETLDLDRFQLPSAQAVFDITFFRGNPKPFFMLLKEMFYTRTYKPTTAHHFIKLLATKGLLHRCYTQNIDGLESRVGIPKDLLVEAHGTFEEATCTNPDCKKKFAATDMKKVVSAITADEIPTCDACTNGVVKPNIIFFGEDLPPRFKELLEADFKECDLLVVMGTSLQVQPFCSLTERVEQTTPRLLINKTRVGNFSLASEGGYRDVAMLEECDKAVLKISQLCEWSQDLDKLVNPVVSKTQSSRPATKTNPTTSKTDPTSSKPKPIASKTTGTGGIDSKRSNPKKPVGSVYQTHSHSHVHNRTASKK